MSACGLAFGELHTVAVIPRRRWAGAVVAALLALVALAAVELVRPWGPADLARVSAPAGALPSQGVWPAGLREAANSAIAADAYRFTAAPDGSWAAGTPSQGLRSTFGSSGPTVGPVGGGWDLRLSLARFGRAGALATVPAAQPIGSAERVEYRRGPALTEWYRNQPRGLEQGFTVARAPSGAAGPLILEMDTAGLRLSLSADGGEVVGRTASGSAVLRYSGLAVSDATGRRVPASLAVEGQAVQLRVDDFGATYPLVVDPWFEQAKLTASDTAADDRFGSSVAVAGDTAVVGAANDDDTVAGTDAGSAYVFVRSGGAWTQQAKLTASDAAARDLFGRSVAVAGDTVVVGAWVDDTLAGTDAGSAYVFVRSGGAWTQQAKLTAADAAAGDAFGFSVAVAGDTAVVGAYRDITLAGTGAGSAYVFVRSGSAWTQQAKLTAADAAAGDQFGFSVAVAGDTAVVGAKGDNTLAGTGAGSAYVLVRSGGAWTQQAKLTAADAAASDRFGWSVAVAGDTAVVGAVNDETLAGPFAGSAYVFARSGGAWTQQAKLTAADGAAGDQFGASVAVAGDTAVVGAPADATFAGSGYVFVRSGGTWAQQAKLTASDAATFENFGESVAVSGDTVLAGAPFADTASGEDAGSAYVFEVATCAGVAATVSGSGGDDALTGTEGADVIAGQGGNDTIDGLGGNDLICGGTGDDEIDAGAGGDVVYGEAGVDTLSGGSEDDTLSGDAGNDTLDGGAGVDRVVGGSGADALSGGEGDDVLQAGAQPDVLHGGGGFDLADYPRSAPVIASIGDGANDGEAGEQDDIQADVEAIRGGSAADTLTGDAGANVLSGQGGADALAGGAGSDVVYGGGGDDTLQGGAGADLLHGDAGSDLAVYPRSAPLSLSIGNGANDGESGELDDIQADVERLRGGSGNDTLTGDGGPNIIHGAAGNDQITGNAGDDVLYGMAGDDTIDGLDGPTYTDRLSCGTENDTTTSDTPDVRYADCETNIGF